MGCQPDPEHPDLLPPTISFSQPEADAELWEHDTLWVAFTITDDRGLSDYALTLRPVHHLAFPPGLANSDFEQAGSLSGTRQHLHVALPLDHHWLPGPLALTVTARDAAGRIALTQRMIQLRGPYQPAGSGFAINGQPLGSGHLTLDFSPTDTLHSLVLTGTLSAHEGLHAYELYLWPEAHAGPLDAHTLWHHSHSFAGGPQTHLLTDTIPFHAHQLLNTGYRIVLNVMAQNGQVRQMIPARVLVRGVQPGH
jgi:hypothetical protein